MNQNLLMIEGNSGAVMSELGTILGRLYEIWDNEVEKALPNSTATKALITLITTKTGKLSNQGMCLLRYRGQNWE